MLSRQEVLNLLSYDPMSGEFRWRVSRGKAREGAVAGTRDDYGYTVIRIGGVGYKAHRLAWLVTYGVWPANLLDHLDRVRHNNRISNLREATAHENALNCQKRKMGLSGVYNVTWFSQYQKWKASFTFKGKTYFVGHFNTVAEATEALNQHPVYAEAQKLKAIYTEDPALRGT